MRINKDLMRSLGLGLLSAQTGPSRTPITGWQTFGKGLASGFDRYNRLQERQAEIARQEIEDKRRAEEFDLQKRQGQAALRASELKARRDAQIAKARQIYIDGVRKENPQAAAALEADMGGTYVSKMHAPKDATGGTGGANDFGKSQKGLAWSMLAEAAATGKPIEEMDIATQMRLRSAKAMLTQPVTRRDPDSGDLVEVTPRLPFEIDRMFGAKEAGSNVKVLRKGKKGQQQENLKKAVDEKIRESLGLLREGGAKGGAAGVTEGIVSTVSRQFQELLGAKVDPVTATEKLRQNLELLTQQLLPEINPDERFTQKDVEQVERVLGQISLMTDTQAIISRLNAVQNFLATKRGTATPAAPTGYTFSAKTQAILDKRRQEQNR